MRQVTRKGLMTMAAATGVIAAAGGAAHADSGAHGTASGSPGVLSGNSVQAPVHAPVNVCGNTVNVIGILNPSVGNSCTNEGGSSSSGHEGSGGHGGSHAGGHASDSPGVGSGNQVQAPVHIPVNVCGNTVDVIGGGNTAEGNGCVNDSTGHPATPEHPGEPGNPVEPGTPDTPDTPSTPDDTERGGSSGSGDQPGARTVTQPHPETQLAHTGSDLPMGLALPVGAGALLAGAILYRKARAAA
ncbi:chaplin family protein [Streptomyces sp. 15-116A]|uniref:chaplin n=1 Tax=Streptomyces sp. 15-116A TaxID=2259035 RepID=UPI0021B48280|nr:chaplin family protein [Streptomyces sp. 15-116A]MCT7352455.1 chaplin family protein [Streptomyces sp. 15-116A]